MDEHREAESSVTVFYSYAHEDERLRKKLETHLSLMRKQGIIIEWNDRKIVPGSDWSQEIDAHLNSASIILLLVSSDFLASEYCYGIEMRRALERHKNGEVQVIPILLRPVDWEGAPFTHLQCLPRDARAVTEWDNRDAAFRDIARGIRTAIEQLPSTSTLPQPMPAVSGSPATASTRAPAVPTDRNRLRMLKRVYTTWIAGVLEQSLHGAALIELGLEEKTDVLDNPWRMLMQEVDKPAQALPEGTHIIKVYDETDGGLLILGEPGAGKTTLLLELTRDLLDRAQTSENAPIPVVFNLSSWAKKRLALSDWLVEELSIRYEVPRRLGQFWVSEDRLLLLLDGLDEVAATARKECIEAINSYRRTHPDGQVVVCSRSTEYLNAPTQLRLHTAVVVQPLTQEQIDTYLESTGKQAEALCEALRQDADLRELATTPLMLTILLFAYMGTSPDKISELTSLEAKREQIFASYEQHMLKRRGASKRYMPEQITHWLTYLAQQMKRQNQTVFYIEQVQPDWLPKQWQRYLYRVLAGGVSGGLLCGLIGAAIGVILFYVFPSLFPSYTSPLLKAAIDSVIGLIIGLNLGSIIGLVHLKSTEIRTAEVITWSWANARLAAIASVVGGSLGWPIIHHLEFLIPSRLLGIAAILFFFLIPTSLGGISFILISLFARRNLDEHRLIISRQRIYYVARRGILVGIYTDFIGFALLIITGFISGGLIRHDIYLVAVGCVSGLITGLIYGVSSGQLETRNSFKPNQGIWRSLYNGGRVLLIVGLIVWLLYDIPVIVGYRLAVNQASPQILSDPFLNGVIFGISIGLFFGLLNGGLACIKHVLLRVFLWRARALPWNCARFLDYAAERILLRKVGGGYIFVHRLLLEYFASLATPFPEEASVVSAISSPPPAISSTPQIDIAHREVKDSHLVPSRKTGFNKEKRIATLIVVATLLLELASGASIFYVIQANPNPYGGGTLVLYDPLSQPLDWGIESNSSFGGACQFTKGVYHISQSKPNRFNYCTEGSDFSNFTFEVQMTISKGDCGGVVFREGFGGKFYYFRVCQDGSYALFLYVEPTGTNAKNLRWKFSSAINIRLSASNVIAVVANGSTLDLYVNKQKIDSIIDSTYSHGAIGLVAYDWHNHPTEVAYNNAKVWTL